MNEKDWFNLAQMRKVTNRICWGSPAARHGRRKGFLGWGPWFGSSPREKPWCWACPWDPPRCPSWPGTSLDTSPGCHRRPSHTWWEEKPDRERANDGRMWRFEWQWSCRWSITFLKLVHTYFANLTVVAFLGTKPVWNWIWNIFMDAIWNMTVQNLKQSSFFFSFLNLTGCRICWRALVRFTPWPADVLPV